MADNNDMKPGTCNGNCQWEHYMFLSICTTCGADDWGSYPEVEVERRPYFTPSPWSNALPWLRMIAEVERLKKLSNYTI